MGLPRISYNSKDIDLAEDVSMLVKDPVVIAIRNLLQLGDIETLVQKTIIRGVIRWEILVSGGASDETRRRQFRQLSTWIQEGNTFTVARDRDKTANTTLSVAAAAGASSFTVTSTTGLTAGDQYILRDKVHVELTQIAVGGITGNVITPEETLNFGYAIGARYRDAEYWPARLAEDLGAPIIQENPPLHFNVVLPFVEDVNSL